MSKIIKSKFKVSRRLGCSLWGSSNDAFVERNYGPGQHGREGMNKPASGYKKQLQAKQRLRMYYGYVTERQFRKIYKEALRRKGDTSINLVGLLESRLDAIIYRLNLAKTIFGARQLVSHKHVFVNGQKVNIPSYIVKPGDEITISDRAKQFPVVMESMSKMERSVPDYLELDQKGFSGKFIRIPGNLSDIPYPVQMEPNLIVEFYSR